MKAGTRGLALTEVCASPSQLYDAVSDVRRMGEWSPECQRCEWIDGAVGPAVGARFKGRNRRGIIRWSTMGVITLMGPTVITVGPNQVDIPTTTPRVLVS
jgi:hypothetical protein